MSTRTIMLPISRGLLEHKDRMGPAIWEFLWFVDKITEDVPDGAGKFHGVVLGGHPVSLAQIAADLKEHIGTTQRNIAALEYRGYIVKRRLPENRCAYVVTNSMKWFRRDRRDSENGTARDSENASGVIAKTHDRHSENAITNKETLHTLQRNPTEEQKPAPHGATTDSLPTWMPLENWQGFIDHRKQIRAALTPRAIKLNINKLASLRERGYSPAEVLDQSVSNGWKGIFELQGKGNGNRAEQRQASNLAAAAEAKRDFGLVS